MGLVLQKHILFHLEKYIRSSATIRVDNSILTVSVLSSMNKIVKMEAVRERKNRLKRPESKDINFQRNCIPSQEHDPNITTISWQPLQL